ncbi:hypothetical protein RchiOBHm_Chr4g0426621 [Rosa chinensis]|uniref:Uncharacterized protein n=1 Tax=Rosa chinensis TaxID=74649 RepID=A0A2P6QZG0_ROSCH|nr:hypothetical protein RchiOBHm_Chr4g0426621 [Rosa chinensis]
MAIQAGFGVFELVSSGLAYQGGVPWFLRFVLSFKSFLSNFFFFKMLISFFSFIFHK